MKHQTALIIATVLTAFVVVLVGGVVFALTPQAAAVNPTAAADTAGYVVTDAATLASTPTATTPPDTSTPQNLYLTTAQVKQIALGAIRGAKLAKTPELVNYKGQMAYEAILGRTTLYIDAFNGTILFKVAAVSPTPTIESSPVPSPTDSPTPSDTGGTSGNGGGNNKQHRAQPAPPPSAPSSPAGGSGGSGGGGDGHHHRHDD